MQAIVTRYLGPSNFKGSRIIAQCEAMRIILSWDDALNSDDNHRAACRELCKRIDDRNAEKYGVDARRSWSEPKVSGTIPSGEQVHVFVKVGDCFAQWG